MLVDGLCRLYTSLAVTVRAVELNNYSFPRAWAVCNTQKILPPSLSVKVVT